MTCKDCVNYKECKAVFDGLGYTIAEERTELEKNCKRYKQATSDKKQASKEVQITQKRWVIVKDGTKVLCGSPKQKRFLEFDKVGITGIRTYMTFPTACEMLEKSAFYKPKDAARYRVIEVDMAFSFEVEG